MIKNHIYNRWKSEYIDGVDLDDIEYLNLTADELNKFFDENYIDETIWGYVSDQKLTTKPIGLVYLDYQLFNLKNPFEKEKKYLIGVVKNKKGKKTIVSVFKYCNNYFFFKDQKIPLTYLLSVEVNSFFREKGLFNKIVLESLNHINIEHPVIITIESEMGARIGTINKIKNIYYSHGFDRDIRCVNEYDDEYIEMLKGNRKLTIKK